MKKLIAALALLIIIVCSFVLYEQSQAKALAALLKEKTDAVVAGYDTMIEKNVVPLQKAGILTATQTAALRPLDALREQIKKEEQIPAIVSLINSVQLSLVSFVASVQPDQSFAASEEITTLQMETSEDGQMNDLLTEYNEAAKKWNDRLESGFSGFKGDLLGSEGALLPYLRFDGQQEYFTTIQL